MPPGAFEPLARVAFDDGWQGIDELPPFKTSVTVDATRKIIARNDSPDISFDHSINPYRGCEHGCVYCFARPSHAYLGLSPGLDFEVQAVHEAERAGIAGARIVGAGLRAEDDRASAPTPIPISRSSAGIRSCAASSKCWSAPAIRSAS